MNFATPTALWWAALALPIVVFYILKIRMRRIPVSTIMFWQQVFEEKQPRSLWQTLRHWLSLLLQLVFLLLLVSALTDPFFASEERSRRRLVVVLDTSASMRAADVSPSRFAVGRDYVEELIGGLRVNDEMALIEAGTQPRVVCGLTSHQRTLREALAGVSVRDGPTRVADAVTLARRLLTNHENARIVVITDGCFPEAAEVASAQDVAWHAIGKPAGNVAITKFQVRRSLSDPVGYQVFIEVRNLSEEVIETGLELVLDDGIEDAFRLELQPGKIWTRLLDQVSSDGGVLKVSLDYDDALAADNTAQALLPERRRIPVTLVTEGHLFLERVFVANQIVDLTTTTSVPSQIDDGSVLVLHRQVPGEIPAGNVLVIQPESATDLWSDDDVVQQPIVAEQDQEHPLMAHVRLENVVMPEARTLTPLGDYHALARSASEDPLFFVIDRPEGPVVVLTVNLDRGDLPLRTAFPILVTNALNWFTGAKGELQSAVSSGDLANVSVGRLFDQAEERASAATATTDAVENVEEMDHTLLLRAPDGSESRVVATEAEATVGPLDQCGLWTLHDDSRELPGVEPELTVAQIACNLTDPAESDLQPPEVTAAGSAVQTAGFGGRPIWFYFVLVAWALVATEWYLYQRRWIT